MPIFVAANIAPKNGVPYAMEDVYLKGGFQVKASTVERDGIDANARKQGMLVYTQSDGKVWVLGNDLVSWSNLSQTINSASTTVDGLMSATDKTLLNTLNSVALTGLSVNTPLVSSGGKTPTLSMQYATSAQDGYLRSSDWIIFNSKGNGNGTVVGVSATAPLTATASSTNPSIAIAQATASTSGYLSSTDWNTFNNKASSAGTITAISGTLPVVVSSGQTPSVSMQAATSSVDGYLKAIDWVTFNNKGNGTVQSISAAVGSPLVVQSGVNTIINMPAASAGASGYLSAADWQYFNSKGVGTVQSVTAAAGTPLVIQGTANNPIVNMSAASSTVAGYMTVADKQKLDTIASGATAYSHPTGDGALHIPATGSTSAGKVLTAGATAGSVSWQTPTGAVSSVNGQTGVIVLTGDDLGLSTTSNVQYAAGQFTSLGVGTPASGVAGEIRATNNITAYYSSDARLKENVVVISDALAKVKQLRGVSFDWTQEFLDSHGGEDPYFNRRHDVGCIAQEVQAVLPEVVATRDDGSLALKYDRLTALLIEAVKELSAEVAALKQ